MMHRRRFLKAAAASVAGFTIVPRHVLGGPRHAAPSEKLAWPESAWAARAAASAAAWPV